MQHKHYQLLQWELIEPGWVMHCTMLAINKQRLYNHGQSRVQNPRLGFTSISLSQKSKWINFLWYPGGGRKRISLQLTQHLPKPIWTTDSTGGPCSRDTFRRFLLPTLLLFHFLWLLIFFITICWQDDGIGKPIRIIFHFGCWCWRCRQ